MTLETLSALSLFEPRVTLSHFEGEPLELELGTKLRAAAQVIEWCHLNGAQILYPGHPDYPPSFRYLEKPPLYLSCLGSAPWLQSSCLSIVGSREPTRRSLEWMETHLPELLRGSDIAVVSGGARGIDQKAHVLSIRSKRPTVVFLPSGFERVYPPEARDWLKEAIAGGGAVLSLLSPWEEVRRHYFEARNHLIASMGNAVFVVEARRRSGSMMTARLARDLGRPLAALPSAPGEPKTAGTLDLVVDGDCAILRDATDLKAFFSLAAVTPRYKCVL